MAEHRGLLLEVEPGGVQLGALAVPDADDEVAADEQVDLAGLDGVVLVDVPEGLEDQEQPVVVALELGTLVGLERVLDGERVQREHLGDPVELVLGRLVHAHPDEVALARRLVTDGAQVVLVAVDGHADAVAVEGAVDDHAAQGTCPRLPFMATLILARHGRTTANATGVLAGRSKGVHLDDHGVEQARRRGSGWPGCRWRSSSPARSSAAGRPPGRSSSGSPTPPRVATERGLLECDYGSWTGRELKTLAKEPLWKTVQAHPSAAEFPDGESMAGMSAGRSPRSAAGTPGSRPSTAPTRSGSRSATAT